MKYELNILERLTLLQCLPAQGDITTIRIVRKLREDLSFSEAEHTRFGIQQDGAALRWDPDQSGATKEVKLGDKALEIIRGQLKKLNDEEALKEEHLSVYDKFVGEAEATE